MEVGTKLSAGVLAGACVTIGTIFGATWVAVATGQSSAIGEFIRQWQPLIAAFGASTVASVAAYIAFGNTSRSIAHAETLEKRRRQRKHAATRALLPLALAQISEYAATSVGNLSKLLAACDENFLPKGSVDKSLVPALPPETLKALSEFIEYSDVLDTKTLEDTIAHIQIHGSRWQGLFDDNSRQDVTRLSLLGYVVDAARIHAGAAAHFDYGRRVSEGVPALTWNAIRKAVDQLGFREDEELKKRMDRLERTFPHP